ncbi:MAG TPA: hypothetical protein PKD90_18905, partial [Phnomibacter sp.]|nr:hypothetical protein [Phnomibacter sp.]
MMKCYPMLLLLMAGAGAQAQESANSQAKKDARPQVVNLKEIAIPNIVPASCDSIGWPPPSN